LTDFDIIAREVSGYRTRLEAIEKRLDEVEKVNARLEEAALITARAWRRFQVIGKRCMRLCAAPTGLNGPLGSEYQGSGLRWPLCARVRFLRDLFGFTGSLAHDVISFSSLHDLLDIWDPVSFDDRERGRI
jgi:hypothetical protein